MQTQTNYPTTYLKENNETETNTFSYHVIFGFVSYSKRVGTIRYTQDTQRTNQCLRLRVFIVCFRKKQSGTKTHKIFRHHFHTDCSSHYPNNQRREHWSFVGQMGSRMGNRPSQRR